MTSTPLLFTCARCARPVALLHGRWVHTGGDGQAVPGTCGQPATVTAPVSEPAGPAPVRPAA